MSSLTSPSLGRVFLSLTAGMAFFSFLPAISNAAEELGQGTVIIEQKGTNYLGIQRLGDWGLASATGVTEGNDENYSAVRHAGNFTLTVKPPEGATQLIEVYEGDTLVETFDSRTANGKLLSGSTLKFSMKYTFERVGDISVNSVPTGLNFELKGPAGKLQGKTPAVFESRVEGAYTIYYKLPKICRPAPPISRKLESTESRRGRVGFTFESKCSVFDDDTPPPKEQPPKEQPPKEEPTPPAPPPQRSPQSPVRVSLTSGSAEVTAGGTARFTLVVLNRSDSVLSNLTVETRYDGSKLVISDARDAQKSTNMLRWQITSLPAGGKWQTNFSGKVAENIGNGDVVSASATVSGEGLEDIRSSQRSDSVQIGALKTLPPSGAPIADVFALMALIAAALLSLALAGVQGLAGRSSM